jgi:DNA repair protein RadC
MNIHDGHRERMRQRFLHYGLDNFDDHNVLEILLFYAQPRRDTNELAHRLMDTFGTLDKVFEASPDALMAVPGIGENAAVLIRLIPAMARRYLIARQTPNRILFDSARAGSYLIPLFLNATEETMYLLCLDAKMELLDCSCLGIGNPNSVHVDIRSIVQTALEKKATAVIMAHNHTCGIALPSEEDRVATIRVQNALTMVGIHLIDHIVVADGDFVSMADSGMLS